MMIHLCFLLLLLGYNAALCTRHVIFICICAFALSVVGTVLCCAVGHQFCLAYVCCCTELCCAATQHCHAVLCCPIQHCRAVLCYYVRFVYCPPDTLSDSGGIPGTGSAAAQQLCPAFLFFTAQAVPAQPPPGADLWRRQRRRRRGERGR